MTCSGAGLAGICAWLSLGCSLVSTPQSLASEASLTQDEFLPEREQEEAPLLALTTPDGRSVPLDRVVVDFFDEDPILTTQFEAEVTHRDRGVIDVEVMLRPPPASSLVSLSVFDGARWSDAAAKPGERHVSSQRGPDDLEPAYRARQTEGGIQIRLNRVVEGTTIKIRGKFSALRSGSPSRWAASTLCHPPARSMSVRLWAEDSDQTSRGDGPPRPTWSWEGAHASGPPMMWSDDDPKEVGVAEHGLSIVRFMPVGHDHAEEPKTLVVLVDTSASHSASYARTVQHLHKLLGSLRTNAKADVGLWVVAFDQTAKTIFRGGLREYDEDVREALLRRGPLGATNLDGALRFLVNHGPPSFDRLLLVSDGVVTAGEASDEHLSEVVRSLARRGLKRMDALSPSSHSNVSLLGLLVDEPARPGALLTPDESPRRAAVRMLRTVGHVTISSPDTRDLYPKAVARVQAGDEVIVAALGVSGDKITLEAYEVVEGIRRTSPIPLRRRWVAGLSIHGRILDFERTRSQIEEQGSGSVVDIFKAVAKQAASRGLFNLWTTVEFEPRVTAVAEAQPRDGAENTSVAGAPRVRGDWRKRSCAMADPGWHQEAVERVELWREKAHRAAPREILDQRVGSAAPLELPFDERPMRLPRAANRPIDGGATLARGEIPTRGEVVETLVEYRAGAFGDGIQGHQGTFSTVMSLLGWGDEATSLKVAEAWLRNEPDSVLSILAVAVVKERVGDYARAGRALGSLIDLYPHRDDVRRFAARSLVRLGAAADRLSHDVLQGAVKMRPLHPTSARALAVDALARGNFRVAAETMGYLIEGAADQERGGSGARARASLRSELGMILAGWSLARPQDEPEIVALRARAGVAVVRERTVLIALGWDAASTDMDLHLRDVRGNHAYYRRKTLPSGGTLSEDASGEFPYEAFVLPAGANAAPYKISVEVHDVGPLGVATGAVDILSFDPLLGLQVEQRPFFVTRARSRVELGELELPRVSLATRRSQTREPEDAKR